MPPQIRAADPAWASVCRALNGRFYGHAQHTRWACLGKINRGKGMKIVAFSDGSSSPLALHTENAWPHEVALVEATLACAALVVLPRLVDEEAAHV